MNHDSADHSQHDPHEDHEIRDVQIRGVLIFIVVLTLATIAIQLLVGVWLGVYSEQSRRAITDRPARLSAEDEAVFPSPRLQPDPDEDMAIYSLVERKDLSSGAPSPDRPKVNRIPISEALDIIAERGLPTRKAADKP